jgi:GntR family transcriptional regulator
LISRRFDPDRPIYLQIVDGFRRALARGELKVGDRVPAVRETAEQLLVNPNTVQRAYQELERMNLFMTKRGLGTFVTGEDGTVRQIRDRLAAAAARKYLDEMKSLGLSPREAAETLSTVELSQPGRKRGIDR